MNDIDREEDDRQVPHALRCLTRIDRELAGGNLVVFLDYDGTLSPIVDDPAAAVLAPGMRGALEALVARWPVAVVSGRERTDVAARVGIEGIFYAGSHGFDIAGPGRALEHEAGRAALPELDAAEAEIRSRLGGIAGLVVERKRFSLAVHYRRVASAMVNEVVEAAGAVAARRRGLRVDRGKKVVELKPDVDWHKGRAVDWLLDAMEVEAGTIPSYIGDDLTDEDAFETLKGRGLTVFVGPLTRPTAAAYRLDDVGQVESFLRHLAALPRPERS